MPIHYFLGQDLSLGFSANEEGSYFAGPPSHVDLEAILRQQVPPREIDLGLVEGEQNLIQSILLRLKTERGELERLGAPTYGSRHHRLVGEPNTENNRNLIRLYVLECLKQEPRVEEVLEINVQPGPGRQNRDKVDISVTLKVTGVPTALSLVVPFSFEAI